MGRLLFTCTLFSWGVTFTCLLAYLLYLGWFGVPCTRRVAFAFFEHICLSRFWFWFRLSASVLRVQGGGVELLKQRSLGIWRFGFSSITYALFFNPLRNLYPLFLSCLKRTHYILIIFVAIITTAAIDLFHWRWWSACKIWLDRCLFIY